MLTRRAFFATPAFAQDAAQDIMQRAVRLDEDNLQKLRRYVFDTQETLDILSRPPKERRGRATKFEVNLVSGEMYWRLTERNGSPLDGVQAAGEKARFAEHLRRVRESGGRAPSGFDWRSERAYLAELPRAHQFRYLREETVDGRRCHVIEGRPDKNFTSHHRWGVLLKNHAGTFTIDTETHHWVRCTWQCVGEVKYELHQLVLGRYSLPYSAGIVNEGHSRKDSLIRFQNVRLDDGTWVPKEYEQFHEGRHRARVTYANFRKFAADSSLTFELEKK